MTQKVMNADNPSIVDAQKRIEGLTGIVRNLVELLDSENQAIRDDDPQIVNGLLETKQQLSQAYESRLLALRKLAPEAVQAVDPKCREALKEVGKRMQELLKENERLLKVGMEANRRVLSAVAEAVKERDKGAGTYNQSGSVYGAKRTMGPRNSAVSLDKSL